MEDWLPACSSAHPLPPCPLTRRPLLAPAETARSFTSKGKRLSIVADTVLTDINTNWNSSAGELQRLIPIQR